MSGYQFDEHEKEEFENILKVLNIDVSKTQKPKPYQQILKKQREQTSNSIKVVPQVNLSEPIPSVKKEWPLFKEWLETKISTLEKLINTLTP